MGQYLLPGAVAACGFFMFFGALGGVAPAQRTPADGNGFPFSILAQVFARVKMGKPGVFLKILRDSCIHGLSFLPRGGIIEETSIYGKTLSVALRAPAPPKGELIAAFWSDG